MKVNELLTFVLEASAPITGHSKMGRVSLNAGIGALHLQLTNIKVRMRSFALLIYQLTSEYH